MPPPPESFMTSAAAFVMAAGATTLSVISSWIASMGVSTSVSLPPSTYTSGTSGVVHQDVQRAELGDGRVDGLAGLWQIDHVCLDDDGSAPERLDRMLHVLQVTDGPRRENQVGTLLGEGERDTFSDATTRTGDDGDLALAREPHLSPAGSKTRTG